MKLRNLLAVLFLFTVNHVQAGFIVDVFNPGTNINNMTTAEALFGGTPDYTGMFDVINFVDSGQSGATHFSGDSPFPGNVQSDFAVHVTGLFNIGTDGIYTFGVRHDDGVDLNINGNDILRFENDTNDRDTFGSIYLTAGLHSLDLGFYENGGGAHLELFAASGNHTSFNSSFSLVQAAVPEPSIILLMGAGLFGMGFVRRKIRK